MTSDTLLTADELEVLRRRLDAIDDGIIDLISERQNVVKIIGEHKLKTGAPLRHFARERKSLNVACHGQNHWVFPTGWRGISWKH